MIRQKACLLAAILLAILGGSTVTSLAAEDQAGAPERTSSATRQWNVLMIAIDDLNDWVGFLEGHPQADTPHLDALAAESMVFENAHCQAPICNPSRASLMLGRLPSSTGLYLLSPRLRQHEPTSDATTLPQHFAQEGYDTRAAGKLFHGQDELEFEQYGGRFGAFGPRPEQPISAGHTHPLWDWGRFPERDEQMPDFKIATWSGQAMRKAQTPWFVACGFYRPHVPMFAPSNWFDLHPLEEIELPLTDPDDLMDVPQYGRDLTWSAVAPRHEWMKEHNEWRHAVQSYLASVSFVDAQVGRVLKALEESGQRDNTIVVVWSDHGFHLGTKQRWGKRSLWEEATRVPLLIRVPGLTTGRCSAPVGLIDLYPTLAELCGLTVPEHLEGQSLLPLLEDPEADWNRPVVTTFGRGCHAVRDRRWRYIVYADGTEELYDMRNDPHGLDNLIGSQTSSAQVERLRQWLPQTNAPLAPGSAHVDARPGSRPAREQQRKRDNQD